LKHAYELHGVLKHLARGLTIQQEREIARTKKHGPPTAKKSNRKAAS
jgi:hypothetical protein